MTTPDGRQVMLQRHEIVVRIIDANSRALRLENEINGLDIERRNAERELDADETAARQRELNAIVARLQTLDAQRQKLMAEKTWLEQALDDFDLAARRQASEVKTDPMRRTSR